MRIRFFLLLICLFFYTTPVSADVNFVQNPNVQAFIKEMVYRYHFNRAYLTELFSNVKIRPRVIRSVRTPLELHPWYTYQMVFITESRIRQGVEFWKRHASILERTEKKYGVPASIIVATIGVETKYGKNTGEFRVIDALTNIAFSDSRRAGYFRNELKEFLLLSREQKLNPLSVLGSYAGAIGQPQFMPSSYRQYAVSYSGRSKIDLSNNVNDIISSIANYYQKHGWQKGELVTVPASLGRSRFHAHNKDQSFIVSPAELVKYVSYNKHLPRNKKVKMIELEGHYGNEYWLGFHNFEVIKQYNPSNLYAMAVYQLSYYIESRR